MKINYSTPNPNKINFIIMKRSFNLNHFWNDKKKKMIFQVNKVFLNLYVIQRQKISGVIVKKIKGDKVNIMLGNKVNII
jgi:hypothetical protein